MEKDNNQIKEPATLYGDNYTYGDYLKFEFDYMVELIRGKIFIMSPAPSAMHQLLCGNIFGIFYNYFKGKSCQVWLAPFDVVLPVQNRNKKGDSHTVVQPDLCVICDREKIDDQGCFGSPDWVLEIISPHTKKKDVQLKYDVYEEAGVREYWVAFPIEKLVEIFVLDAGKYRRVGMYTPEDVVHSQIFPELKVDLEAVFDYEIYNKKNR
jgi:Uma2 family endonuclease